MTKNLTPELLAQLEKDAAGFSKWLTEIGGDIEPHFAEPIARMLNAAPALMAAAKEFAAWRDEEDENLARANAGLDTYVEELGVCRAERDAAAKERDHLRAQLDNVTALRQRDRDHVSTVAVALGIDGWENGWPDVAPRIEHMRTERDQLRAEVTTLKAAPIKWDSTAEVLMADYGRRMIRQLHDRYLEALALESENDKLEAEVERLRGLGLEMVAEANRTPGNSSAWINRMFAEFGGKT